MLAIAALGTLVGFAWSTFWTVQVTRVVTVSTTTDHQLVMPTDWAYVLTSALDGARIGLVIGAIAAIVTIPLLAHVGHSGEGGPTQRRSRSASDWMKVGAVSAILAAVFVVWLLWSNSHTGSAPYLICGGAASTTPDGQPACGPLPLPVRP